MKRFTPVFLLAIAVGSAAVLPTSVHAQRISASPHSRYVVTVFRLHVTGDPAAGTTFWVAYGPLQGRWGVLRLRSRGAGNYTVAASLPRGRTTFAYLAAQGTVQTRLGPAPGGVPVTIKLVGPVTTSARARITVRWQVPLG